MIRVEFALLECPRVAYGLRVLLDQSRLLATATVRDGGASGDPDRAARGVAASQPGEPAWNDHVLLRVVDAAASTARAWDGSTEAFARAMASLLQTPEDGGADRAVVQAPRVADGRTFPRADALRLLPHGSADAATGRWFRVGDGEVTVAGDALRAVADLAGLVTEQRSHERDRHGRVPAGVNALVRGGLARVPVLALAGYALREAVRAAAGRRPVRLLAPWPDGRRWAVSVTHDLDVVDLWPAFTALRLMELARKGRVGDVGRVVARAAVPTRGGHVLGGARAMVAAEGARGVRSTWYVLAGRRSWRGVAAGDVTYRLDGSRARRILEVAGDAGAEVGLHGSFGTYDEATRFAEERAHVAAVMGAPPPGVRQHYLRLLPGRSHRAMQAAGFRYDATVGFADRNGFRVGVGDVVPAWDEAAGVALDLDLVPLAWMDRALSKYAGVESPDAWVDDALVLASRCRATEGLWSGLWHPNLVPALGYPGAPRAYERLLDGLLADAPFTATSAELVAWRRARRSCRAVGVQPDGTVDLVADAEPANGLPGVRHTLVLEDGDGRPEPGRVVRASAVDAA